MKDKISGFDELGLLDPLAEPTVCVQRTLKSVENFF
jgi:hypothetical protein